MFTINCIEKRILNNKRAVMAHFNKNIYPNYNDPHLIMFQGTWRSTGNGNYSFYGNGKESLTPGFPGHFGSEWSLAMSPPPSDEAKISLLRPKNIVQRARMNVA